MMAVVLKLLPWSHGRFPLHDILDGTPIYFTVRAEHPGRRAGPDSCSPPSHLLFYPLAPRVLAQFESDWIKPTCRSSQLTYINGTDPHCLILPPLQKSRPSHEPAVPSLPSLLMSPPPPELSHCSTPSDAGSCLWSLLQGCWECTGWPRWPAPTSHLPLSLQMAPLTGSAVFEAGGGSWARRFPHGCGFLVSFYLVQPGLSLGSACPGSVWGQGLGHPLCPGDQHSRSLRLQRPVPLLASTSFDLITEGELISYKLALLFNASVLSGVYTREPSGPQSAGLLTLAWDFNNLPRSVFNVIMMVMVCRHSHSPSQGASATWLMVPSAVARGGKRVQNFTPKITTHRGDARRVAAF